MCESNLPLIWFTIILLCAYNFCMLQGTAYCPNGVRMSKPAPYLSQCPGQSGTCNIMYETFQSQVQYRVDSMATRTSASRCKREEHRATNETGKKGRKVIPMWQLMGSARLQASSKVTLSSQNACSLLALAPQRPAPT